MSKQVNVRLSDFHVRLLDSFQQVHSDLGVDVSQARLIESALEQWLGTEPNLRKAVSEKMDLGFFGEESIEGP